VSCSDIDISIEIREIIASNTQSYGKQRAGAFDYAFFVIGSYIVVKRMNPQII